MKFEWPISASTDQNSQAEIGGEFKFVGTHIDSFPCAKARSTISGTSKAHPAPLKACPWCGTEFTPSSFACIPNEHAPTNLEIRCVNTGCDFSRNRPLPILTVDEAIYRRLPAFVIATVDKFAGLPWLAGGGQLVP